MMEPSVDQRPTAWQPLTPRGVGLFAWASFRRLFLMQLLVALLNASVIVWALNICWYPTISTAIDQLPQQGTIQAARLTWFGQSPQVLAESRFLALAVDLTHAGGARSPSHLQVEFGQTDLRICSVFGCSQILYPPSYVVGFNFQELKPWWGAWAPIISALVFIAAALGLMVSWGILATIYCLPTWILALYCERELTLAGSWRLAGAALVPGAFVMMMAIGLYGLAQLDLLRLISAFALHFLIGWAYVILGTTSCPKLLKGFNRKTNPFVSGPAGPDAKDEPGANRSNLNPFRPSGD